MKTLKRRIMALLIVVLALAGGALAWWTAGVHAADAAALAAVADEDGPTDGVTVRALADGSLAFEAADARAGMVFYPGGQVQPEAYAPLLTRCARQGVTCVLVQPPLDFALLAINAAEGVPEQFPGLDTWLLCGHSLGGVAACEYLARHEAAYDGIVLLASYPNADLSDYAGAVLQLTGTKDGVISRDKLAATRELLPADAQALDIAGGNHAQFGNYGVQAGDGQAEITGEEQQVATAQLVATFAEVA